MISAARSAMAMIVICGFTPSEEGMALQDPARPRRTALDRGLYDYDPLAVPV